MTVPGPAPLPIAPIVPSLPPLAGAGHTDDVRRQLLARRMVLVHGVVDDALAAEVSATLMMLDATGEGRVLIRLTGADATFEAGLVLVDVIGALGVPVDVVAAGTIAGGAVGVLAAARDRAVAPHARLHLREPDGSVAGRAVDIERVLAAQAGRRDQFLARIASCTGRPRAAVEEHWSTARFLEPADAVALGYADRVEQSPTSGTKPPVCGE